MPAYEWNFSDVNPPVHAFATLFLHRTEQALRGEDGPGVPQGGVQQAAAELHLVGEPQGPLRQERLRGRLPRPRQHRRLRPQRPAAHRRPPGAGGRHGLDGPLQPEHAGTRGGARRPRPHLRGHGREVRRALLLYRRGHEPARSGRHVGRGGRLLLRPAAAPRRQRHAAQGALHGGAPAPVRHHGDRDVAAGARSAGDGSDAGTPAPDARTSGDHPPHGPGTLGRGRAGDHCPGQPGAAPPDSHEDARRERVPEPLRHPLALQVPRAAPVHLPRARPGVPGGLPAGRVEHRHVRRQLQLAGTGLDAGEHA